MKTKFKTRSNIRKIRTLHELEMEKARLQVELVKTEEQISSAYRHLMDHFSFRNIIKKTADEINMTTNVVSKAVAIGKDIFGKVKKKKKKWKERHKSATTTPDTEPVQPSPPFPDTEEEK